MPLKKKSWKSKLWRACCPVWLALIFKVIQTVPTENCKSDHISRFPKKQLRFSETCNLIRQKMKYIKVKSGVFRPFFPLPIIQMKSPCKWQAHTCLQWQTAPADIEEKKISGAEPASWLSSRSASNNGIMKKRSSPAKVACQASTCFTALSLRTLLQCSASIKLALQQSISVKRVLVGQGIKSMSSKLQQIKGK